MGWSTGSGENGAFDHTQTIVRSRMGAMVANVLIRGRDVVGGEREQPGKEGVG